MIHGQMHQKYKAAKEARKASKSASEKNSQQIMFDEHSLKRNRYNRFRLEYEGMNLQRDWQKLKVLDPPPNSKKRGRKTIECRKLEDMLKAKEPEIEIIEGPERVPKCMSSSCELESNIFVNCSECRKEFHQACLKPKPVGSKSKHQLCYDCYARVKRLRN